jgi:type II secretory pathway component PulF
MAVFSYKAVDGELADRSGTIVADSTWLARDLLRAKGLTVQHVAPESARRGSHWAGRFHAARLTTFVRELSTLLGAGLPLLDSIDAAAEQHRGGFRTCLLLLREDISAGLSLAQAMRRQGQLFDEMCISVTEVGESTGTLESSLERLAEFRERSGQLRSRIGTALLYPTIVLMLGIGVGVLLMTVVVPDLLAALVEAGRPLPWATRVVRSMSEGLVRWWWLLLAIAGLGLAMMTVLLRTQQGRWLWHRLVLRLPLVGEMARKQAVVQVAVVLAALLRAGVVLVGAVQIAQRSVNNEVLRRALQRFETAIQAGQDLGPALEATGAFPRTVVQLLAVGQQSGRLEEMLDRLASDYEKQLSVAAQRLTAALEPLLIVLLAALIGFIAFATILPILEAGHVL